MSAKSNYLLVYEFIMLVAIAFGALLCIFPYEQGMFFRWWENHAVLVMLSYLAMGLIFFFFNRIRVAMASFIASGLLCLILDARTQAPLKYADPTNSAALKIAQFGITNNSAVALEAELINMLQPEADLISLQGIPLASLESVSSFFTCCGYQYFQSVKDSIASVACAIYSRYPFEFAREVYYPAAPGIIGKVIVPDEVHGERAFYFFNPYFYPAKDITSYQLLQQQLQRFANGLKQIDAPLLVFGDYNLVPWSKDLQTFRTTAGLHDSRRSVIRASLNGSAAFFDYPLDHIFYSNHFKCINFETISSVMTPRLGIVGTYQFEDLEVSKNAKQTSQKF